MTAWTPELEKHIAKVADYAEGQLREFLHKSHHPRFSAVKMAFNFLTTGKSALEKACALAGVTETGWNGRLRALADIAGQNGSPVADRLEKVLAISVPMTADFKREKVVGMLAQIRHGRASGASF